jgi:hypothetical protein
VTKRVGTSPEQMALADAAALCAVSQGDFGPARAVRTGQLGADTATDVLEHLGRDEIRATFGDVARILLPGAALVGRAPKGEIRAEEHIRCGNFTHAAWLTAASIRQPAAAAERSHLHAEPKFRRADGGE